MALVGEVETCRLNSMKYSKKVVLSAETWFSLYWNNAICSIVSLRVHFCVQQMSVKASEDCGLLGHDTV